MHAMLRIAYQNIIAELFVIKQHKIQIYKAPKFIYSLLLSILYSVMVIIKQTNCLPGWDDILLFKCQIEFDWMNVLAVGAWRKILLKNHKHATMCTCHCNHLSTIFHQRDQESSFLQLQVFSFCSCFHIWQFSRRFLWRSKCIRWQP